MANLLWQSETTDLDEQIMRFLAGEDVVLDQHLFVFDIEASQAHVRGLASIGVLPDDECNTLCGALDELRRQFNNGEFKLDAQFEDGHSAIEWWLTERLGELGGKVHAGRSRNDQVLVASRLYLLAGLKSLQQQCKLIARACLDQAREHEFLPIPGYTHLQRAVPSSVGLWMAGFAEAFIDNAQLATSTHDWLSSNPLGTAAGYGVNLRLDRELTTQELGFERLQINPMYAQNSRGKFELQMLMALSQALLDVRRLAWDLSLYTTSEFDFVKLPEKYTTGSSIMPNKRNPDVVELLRAAYPVAQGAMSELSGILSLSSGYHRDLQGTKGPLIRATEHGLMALRLIPNLVNELSFNKTKMSNAFDRGMFATDLAVDLAAKSIPFRQAYRLVKEGLDEIESFSARESITKRTSSGACADLRLDELQARLDQL